MCRVLSRAPIPRAITRRYREIHRLMEVAAGYRGFRGTKSSPNRWLFSILRAELYVVVNAWAKTCAGLRHVCLRYGISHASFLPHCARWRRHQSLLRSRVLCETPPLRDYCGNDTGHQQGNVEAEALK